MRAALILLICILLTSCTGSKKTIGSKASSTGIEIVNFESPINFSYNESLRKKDVAYKIGDTEYPLSQLFRSDKSLLRLVTDNKRYWVTSAYLQALSMKGQEQKQMSIEIPFSNEGLNLDEILQSKQLTNDPSITVTFSNTAQPGGVTKINGKNFSETELSKNNLDHSRNLQKIFNLAMKRIETRVSRTVISEAAKNNSQDFNQFVKENSPEDQKVGKEQIKEFARENSIPEKDITEKMAKTLRQIIKSKNQNTTFVNLASSLLKDKTVEVSLYRPYIWMDQVNHPEGTPRLGSGKVQVTLISNFLCKRCIKAEQKLTDLFEKVADKVQISYLFQIRPEERMSKFVAEAGLCVHRMDQNKFWDFHRKTFNKEFDGNESKINTMVESMGLSVDELRKCFSSRESSKTLKSQLEITNTMKALTLPIVMINGNIFENPGSTSPIESLIDYEFENYREPFSKSNKSGWLAWFKNIFTSLFG